MRVWYDTEFHERGPDHPIDLISIGMVREDGAELYLVNADCDWEAILANPWLREHVVPSLPTAGRFVLGTAKGLVEGVTMETTVYGTLLDRSDPRVQPREAVAAEVKEFLAEAAPNLELWAWYADYDHVVLSQLFGRMIDLPDFVPMYTRDLKQEVDRLAQAVPDAPALRFNEIELREKYGIGAEHDALADAKYCRAMALETRDQYLDWTNA